MSKFIDECNQVVEDIRQKANNIQKKDYLYLQRLYSLEDETLKTALEHNTKVFREFVCALAERTFKKTNTMTYTTIVRFLCIKLKVPYSLSIGFACLNKDKYLYTQMQKDLSEHPFPVNHLYITVQDNVELECFVFNRDKVKHFEDICHADFVIAEKHTQF